MGVPVAGRRWVMGVKQSDSNGVMSKSKTFEATGWLSLSLDNCCITSACSCAASRKMIFLDIGPSVADVQAILKLQSWRTTKGNKHKAGKCFSNRITQVTPFSETQPNFGMVKSGV